MKEEAAAPTVALESVFITTAIDAKEHWKVVTIDIPGAFLHADNEDYVIMKMVGTLAELMVKTNPKLYRKYVVNKKGCSVVAESLIWNDKMCNNLLQKIGCQAMQYGF
jgi:hypothetical protein